MVLTYFTNIGNNDLNVRRVLTFFLIHWYKGSLKRFTNPKALCSGERRAFLGTVLYDDRKEPIVNPMWINYFLWFDIVFSRVISAISASLTVCVVQDTATWCNPLQIIRPHREMTKSFPFYSCRLNCIISQQIAYRHWDTYTLPCSCLAYD